MGGACAPPACPRYFYFVTVCAYRIVETSLLSARKSQSKSSVGGHFLSFKSSISQFSGVCWKISFDFDARDAERDGKERSAPYR
jgi:hypothetical protein